MNDWITACCKLMEPLYQHLVKTVTSCDYIKADESPIKLKKMERPEVTTGFTSPPSTSWFYLITALGGEEKVRWKY